MSTSDLSERIARAKELLKTVRHAAIATVNEDGSPHNAPVFIAFDNHLQAYWASHPDSMHSQNIRRTGQVYIVLFDALGDGGGLYVQASAHEVPPEDLNHALTTFNQTRERLLREHIPLDHFVGDSPQRLYQAMPQTCWVNLAERDEEGRVIQDRRYEISLTDLMEK